MPSKRRPIRDPKLRPTDLVHSAKMMRKAQTIANVDFLTAVDESSSDLLDKYAEISS
jgi:hypothetical protein